MTNEYSSSGRIELPEEEPIGDYFVGGNDVFSSIEEQRQREQKLAEEKLARAMKESGWGYEF